MEATDVVARPLETDRLWNETEAARYLGLSVEFMQQDRSKAVRIPFIKIGRSVRYEPCEVIGFKEACKVRKSAATRQAVEVTLAHFKNDLMRSKPLPASPGVYCLLWEDSIQYIGMASDIARRVQQHTQRLTCRFDEVQYFKCNESKARDIERRLIGEHNPPHNRL